MNTNTITLNPKTLNAISGAVAGPLVKMLWEMSDCNPDALNHFQAMLGRLVGQGRYDEAVELLCLLYDMVGMKMPDTLTAIFKHLEAQSHFLSELLLDAEEIVQEFVGE